MEYLPTLGLFKITLGVNVGKYSIHGSSGYSYATNIFDCFPSPYFIMWQKENSQNMSHRIACGIHGLFTQKNIVTKNSM